MKSSRSEFINNILNQFPITNKNDVLELYKLYSMTEINDYNEIVNATNDFFVCLKFHQLYSKHKYFSSAVDSAFSTLIPMINSLTFGSFEKKFAEMVLELSPVKPDNAHILDVGPNKFPISSLAMATEAKQVSAMDKDFILAIESLKAMNVEAMENFFDESTPVDDYDLVVGKCPCSAIGHIVANCAKANKPYFLELCNCAVPNRKTGIRDEFGNEVHTWKNVLPDIDPNVKFYDNYAFNLDASPEQVKKVVDKINHSIVESKKFKVKSDTIFIPNPIFSSTGTIKPNDWNNGKPSDEKPWEFDWE